MFDGESTHIEFFWDDLTPEKQRSIRDELEMSPGSNGSWDVFPIAVADIKRKLSK